MGSFSFSKLGLHYVIVPVLLLSAPLTLFIDPVVGAADLCQTLLTKELREEIQGYQQVVNNIVDTVIFGALKGKAYENLVTFVDQFGGRATGTENLEKAIDFMVDKMKQDGLDNVKEEQVIVPNWIRAHSTGRDNCTDPGGENFEELQRRAGEATGKIVVFNQDYRPNYSASSRYRLKGAVEAAKVGAVACLVRSVTPFSISSPHTGLTSYDPDAIPIPVAAMSVEDAQFLSRLQVRRHNVTIKLVLNDNFGEPKISRNTMGDLTGQEKPNSVVLIGCHIDSWDVGDGAMDDAGGCIISLEALQVMTHLNLRPRRTLRAIFFTAEEEDDIGAQHYIKDHTNELDTINALMESDSGTFAPSGLDFAGADMSACIVKEILTLLKSFNTSLILRHQQRLGGDTMEFIERGVPAVTLSTQEEKYFWFHHTDGDTLDVENSDELDSCLVVWTATAFVLADLSVDLPRKIN